MSAALKVPSPMTVAEFLLWDAPSGPPWQLVDGEPQAMAPAAIPHGSLQSELSRLIGNHLEATDRPCFVVTTPGVVPGAFSAINCRIPDLAVTCAAPGADTALMSNPVLIIEILSPSNRAETWSNVWSYATIPSVQEILILRSTEICADPLRRSADGAWPDRPATMTEGRLTLDSIGLTMDIRAPYRTTGLASG